MDQATKDTGAARTVMIVEDDLDIRDALTQILEFEGYHVVSAENGQQALTQLQHGEHPGLILLDLMMPVMDGWQFRLEQQKDAKLSDIPVVIISADGRVYQKASAIGA